jgi:hypothetical protein
MCVSRRETWGGRVLLAGVAAGVFVCIDLENAGARKATAFEGPQFEVKTKTIGSGETTSLNGKVRYSDLSIKVDTSVVDLNPQRVNAITSYFAALEPIPIEKSAVTDTRVTLGLWDDSVRWTSRQAFSNYIKPGTDLGYLSQTGVGLDRGATSQRIETSILKIEAMRLSLFADYARVGAYFAAPDFAIKRQDPFSKPNSTTTRLGAIVEQGPITFTLEQSNQQSLAQDNAPILVHNQIGVWLSFDKLLGRSGNIQEGLSWIMPSSAWLNVGQGRMRAEWSQGVDGDTTSDVSVGLSWSFGKIYANLGYWYSDYQSQLYPWKGSSINGSLGFYEGRWGVDMYFDVGRSATHYGYAGMPQSTTQTYDLTSVTSGLRFHTSLAP